MKVISAINNSGLYSQSGLSAATASYDSNGNLIVNTYATKAELPSTAGLMESSKLEVVNDKITGYDGTAFAGGGGNTYTTTDTNYLTIDNDESTINFTDKTKQAIDNVPTGTNYDLVGGNNIKFTVDDTEHQIVIDVEAPLSTYQIFDYATTNAQQTIDCWKSGKIPVLRIEGNSALLWPCRISALDPSTLTTASYQYFGCNYNASSFTAYLYGESTKSSGLFTACDASTYNSFTANANKWLSAVSSQSANWNTVSSLSANKEDKITYGYNDNKIVSINGSALSAGSNYEGISPIIVDNENKTVGAYTKEVVKQAFTHDDSLVHTETDDQYALGVNTNVVALKREIPDLDGYLKYSDLTIDANDRVTNISGNSIYSYLSYKSYRDDRGNLLTATYATKSEVSSKPGTLLGECFVYLCVPTGTCFETSSVLSASGFSSTSGFVSALNNGNLYFHSDIKKVTGVNVEYTYCGSYGFTVGSANGHYWTNLGGGVQNAVPANGKTFSRVGYCYQGAQSGTTQYSIYDGLTKHYICTGNLGDYCSPQITHRISNINSARNKWSTLSSDWVSPYVCIKCYKA